MYISEVTIANYRNYSNATISFYENLNVIIGENNAGKSNLLKALRLVLDKNFPKNLEAHDFYNFLPTEKKISSRISKHNHFYNLTRQNK